VGRCSRHATSGRGATSDRDVNGDGRCRRQSVLATPLRDASPLTLAAAAPDPVVDSCIECVLKAGCGDGTVATDLAGAIDADAVAGEEGRRRVETAVAVGHPCCFGVWVVGSGVQLLGPLIERGPVCGISRC
jgi:hypothetical protein